MNQTDFREYLRDELLKRCKRNSHYSLRSFASSLGINHALLSMILSGKRKLTPKSITMIASQLGLSPNEINQFLNAKEVKINSKKYQIKKMNQLSLDIFLSVSEWYHDAIMELSNIDGFIGTAKYISSTLGISIGESQAAIERLSRIGLITIKPNGEWEKPENYTTIKETDFTSAALRAFQKNILNLSTESINHVPKPLRDHSSITMSIHKNDLHVMKEKIKSFRRELMAFAQREENEKHDDVYCLSVSLFPLTKFYKNNKY